MNKLINVVLGVAGVSSTALVSFAVAFSGSATVKKLLLLSAAALVVVPVGATLARSQSLIDPATYLERISGWSAAG